MVAKLSSSSTILANLHSVTAPSGQEQVAREPLLPIVDVDRDRALLGAAAAF